MLRDADYKTCWRVAKYGKMKHQTIIKGIRNEEDRIVTSEEEIAEELRVLSFLKTEQEKDIEISVTVVIQKRYRQ